MMTPVKDFCTSNIYGIQEKYSVFCVPRVCYDYPASRVLTVSSLLQWPLKVLCDFMTSTRANYDGVIFCSCQLGVLLSIISVVIAAIATMGIVFHYSSREKMKNEAKKNCYLGKHKHYTDRHLGKDGGRNLESRAVCKHYTNCMTSKQTIKWSVWWLN